MSSDIALSPTLETGLLADDELLVRYGEVLRRDMPPELQPLADFFADLSRLTTLTAMLERHLDSGPRGRAVRILNIGCGPMAIELFCAILKERRIDSIDYTPAFVDFAKRLQSGGLLPNVTIQQGDVMEAEWPDGVFDAILLNDILYESALDIAELLPRVSRFLAPGGYVYLDVMDARVGPLWRALGRERGYRRYSPAEWAEALRRSNLIEIDRCPVRPRDGALRQGLHRLLRLAGLSNAVAISARKDGAP